MEKGIMKKTWTVFLWLACVLFITAASINCAENGTVVVPSGDTQAAVAADSDQYVIGPEDVLAINVWKEESITKTVPVRIDGKISLPLVNDIQAAGLTPLQLKEALTEKLKSFVENPTVTVTVMEANSFKVYVSGKVQKPGVYLIRSKITLVKLIILAGGFTEWADQEDILVITKVNGVEKKITVDYKEIIEGEGSDIEINRGDMVIVP